MNPLPYYYADDPWRMLVVCLLLERRPKAQVEQVLDAFFDEYPTADTLAHAKAADIRRLVWPLSISMSRTNSLIRFSESFALAFPTYFSSSPPSLKEVSVLEGIGKYEQDCYSLFVLGELSVIPTDRELIQWKNARWAVGGR